MRAQTIADGQLAPADLPMPHPAAGALRIRVAYAGVNRADVFQRMGTYPAPTDDSPLPGLEVSGHVDAVSDEAFAAGWRVGMPVCALTPGGGYAEYVCTPAAQCFAVPQGWSLEHAAALPETCMTLALSVLHTAGATPGMSVCIQGGTSGIGSVAIPLLRLLGMRVFATARTLEKCAQCEQWGALKAVVSDSPHAEAELLAANAGQGMDVVLDMLGGDYLNLALASLARGGHLVSIAFLNGTRAPVKFGQLLSKNLHWHGVTLRSQPASIKSALAQRVRETLLPLCTQTEWRPTIDRVFSLSDAAKAHARMEERLHLGKILLRVEP